MFTIRRAHKWCLRNKTSTATTTPTRSEAERIGSDIRFVSVLPQLTPETDLGRLYTEAYSGSAVAPPGPSLTLDQVATSIVGLAIDDGVAAAFLLDAAGLQPLD